MLAFFKLEKLDKIKINNSCKFVKFVVENNPKLFFYRYLIKQTKKPERNLLAKTNIDTIAYDISVCPFVQRNIIMAQRYVFYFGKSNIPTDFYF